MKVRGWVGARGWRVGGGHDPSAKAVHYHHLHAASFKRVASNDMLRWPQPWFTE